MDLFIALSDVLLSHNISHRLTHPEKQSRKFISVLQKYE